MLLDQASLGQQVLLELGDVIQRGLGVLLAGDGKIELVLLLGEQFKELRHMPDVLLPVELRSPGAVPRTVGHVLRILVDRLDGRLAAASRELVLDPALAADRYRARMAAHLEAVRGMCAQLGIQRVLCGTEQPLQRVLEAFMEQRTGMSRVRRKEGAR